MQDREGNAALLEVAVVLPVPAADCGQRVVVARVDRQFGDPLDATLPRQVDDVVLLLRLVRIRRGKQEELIHAVEETLQRDVVRHVAHMNLRTRQFQA